MKTITIRRTSDVAAVAKATKDAFEQAERLVENDLAEQQKISPYCENNYKIQLWPAYWNDNGHPERSFSLTAVTKRRIR